MQLGYNIGVVSEFTTFKKASCLNGYFVYRFAKTEMANVHLSNERPQDETKAWYKA